MSRRFSINFLLHHRHCFHRTSRQTSHHRLQAINFTSFILPSQIIVSWWWVQQTQDAHSTKENKLKSREDKSCQLTFVVSERLCKEVRNILRGRTGSKSWGIIEKKSWEKARKNQINLHYSSKFHPRSHHFISKFDPLIGVFLRYFFHKLEFIILSAVMQITSYQTMIEENI